MRKKTQTAKRISEQLTTLNALHHWVIKWGYGKVKLYYPKAHARFAEKFRVAIEDHLKFERIMLPEIEVQLIPKTQLK